MANEEILFLTVAGNKIIDKCNNDIVVNNVEIDNSINNIYTGTLSMKFNGTNSYIELPCTEEFNFSNNDFTIDWWEYRNAIVKGNSVLCIEKSPTDNHIVHCTIGVGWIEDRNPSIFISNDTLSWDYTNTNTLLAYAQSWTHQAIVRKGNTISFFTNGNLIKQENTSVIVGYNPTYKIDIGVRNNNYYDGNLQNIRISNYARWDNDFDLFSIYPSFYIKQNNKYYSFSKDNYDTTTKMYKEVTLDDIKNFKFGNSTLNLTKEATIGDETFKPIDKFTNFQLISSYNNEPKTVIGSKSKSGLIVANGDIYAGKISNRINSFTLEYTVNNNSAIKMAVSFDNGSTWKTYKDGTFQELSITIPNKYYANMTDEEKTNYSNAKTTILENGFNASDLSSIDFNIDNLDTIRFAYVLYQDNINDDCKMSDLSWNFNAKGYLQKMKDSEVDTSFCNGIIKITPLIDCEMIITNYNY